MKRKILCTVLIATILSFAGCSSSSSTPKDESSPSTNSSVDNEEETPEEPEETQSESIDTQQENAPTAPPSKDTPSDDSTIGEVVQGDGYTKTPVITDKALNHTGTVGPITYEISAIQISNLKATTDDAAEMFDIEKDKDVAIVALDVSIENTSDDNISFYFGQAVLTTNTKEQVEPSIFFSDYIDGDYLGNVIHSGTLIYILPNSIAEDITNITLHISGPTDENWNKLDEDFTIDLNFK